MKEKEIKAFSLFYFRGRISKFSAIPKLRVDDII